MSPAGFVIAEEKTSSTLTLIVDKKGIFGKDIAEKIHQDITTVLVTARQEQSHGNTLVVPYAKTIPEIPEGDYTHIFFVWDGRSETLHVLEPLLQKASEDKSQFTFITDYHCYNEKLVRFIHQEYTKASILFVGDVFGNEYYESAVVKLFHEATSGTLQLTNVGLSYVYPVLFADALVQIVRVGFGIEKGKLYFACQRHGITELSLSHILQKVDPLLKIDFKKDQAKEITLPEGIYLFDMQYAVTRKIQDTYTDLLIKQKKENPAKIGGFFFSPVAIPKEMKKNHRRRKILIGFLFCIGLFFLSPVFITLGYAGLGSILLYTASNDIKMGNYNQAIHFSQTSVTLFTTALSTNSVAKEELHMLLLGNVANSLTSAMTTGNFFASLLTDGGKAAADFSAVARGSSLTPQADFLSGINAIKNGLITLENIPVDGSVGDVSLSALSANLQPLASVLDVSPTLFGFAGQKTYMVLFQNNTELRPGGGFIGSYALVTVANGKIVNYSIHDVYDADGQLKGHIEPPYVIRRYIPEQHWYLRDSNFDVDFTKDSQNAAFFLSTETGQKVDGVIGVDLTFVKVLLSGIGQVYVPEYNETVNADNFFLLTETHAEKNSFAGSTQKKDFLEALLLAVQAKIASVHGFSPKAIVPLLATLQSKDVVFGFSDPLTQDVFTISGLSDALWDGRKTDTATLNDTTGINEANIGVNKANYFVTREVTQQLTVDETGSVSGILSITYENDSKKGVFPGGPYKNYLRVILPQGASLSSIIIDGKNQTIVPAITGFQVYEAKGFTPPSGLEVDNALEEGKQLFGFVVTIPELTTQKIDIHYTLSQKVSLHEPTFTYNGWLVKQPGVDMYPYEFSLTVPNTFSLLQKPDWIQGSGNGISFSKEFGEDTPFSVTFAQK